MEKKKVKSSKKGSYLAALFKSFKDSWTELDSKVVIVMFFDVLFWVLMLSSVVFLSNYAAASLQALSSKADISTLPILDTAAVSEATDVYFQVLLGIIIFPIMIIVLAFLLYSISRYFIWGTIAGKKISFKLMLRFMGMVLLWSLIWFIPLLIEFIPFIFAAGQARANGTQVIGLSSLPMYPLLMLLMGAMLLTLYIIAYMSVILFLRFFSTEKARSSIVFALKNGFQRFHLYLIPIALVFVVTKVADILVSSLISLFKLPPGDTVAAFVSATLLAFFFAWSRFYLAKMTRAYVKEE
jgi:hypothetical protein